MFTFLLNHIRKSPHRNHLESYVAKYLPLLTGSVLDIGSKNRRYDHLLHQTPTSIDIIENKAKDVHYGDVNNLIFDDNSFDAVVCLEVLEYVSDIHISFSEISRVIKPKGTFVGSIPFMYKVHEDKARYTHTYLHAVLAPYFSKITIYPIGNFYTIILDIIRGKIIKIKYTPLKYFFYILYAPFVCLIPISKISKDKNYVSGYFIMCHK